MDVRTAEQQAASPEGQAEVYALCGTKAVRLGRARQFVSSYHAGSRGTVAVLRDGQRSQVLFVAPGPGDTLHLDDVSRELTKLSGRYIEAGLGSVEVDLSRFAVAGSIGVPVVRAGQPTSTASLDLLPYAAFAITPVTATPTSPQPAPTASATSR